MNTITVDAQQLSGTTYFYPNGGELVCTCEIEMPNGSVEKRTLRTTRQAYVAIKSDGCPMLCTINTHRYLSASVIMEYGKESSNVCIVNFNKGIHCKMSNDELNNKLVKRIAQAKLLRVHIKSNKPITTSATKQMSRWVP